SNMSEYQIVKKDIESIRERVVRLETMYLWFREERSLFRRERFADARRKILFKHLISSTRRAFELLRKFNRFENNYNRSEERRVGKEYRQRRKTCEYHKRSV